MESVNQKKTVQSSEFQSVRKRHRVAVVCINCRRKKIKCDKKRPDCENCLKSNLKCRYQELVWAASTMVDEKGKMSSIHDYSGQNTLFLNTNGGFRRSDPADKSFQGSGENQVGGNINTLKSKVTVKSELPKCIPALDMNETMNFFEGTLPTDEIVRSGPLSWVIFASKDRFIKFLWSKAAQTKQRQILYINRNFTDKTATDERFSLDSHSHLHKFRNLKQKTIIPSYQPLPLENIRNVILKSLPTKKALWILISRFFDYFFPYLSFLDWKQFINTIEESLNTKENDLKDERFISISISNKQSLCHFAVLFIVLRFGYLSLCEEVADFKEERDYISTNPITVDSVKTSQLLLNQFNIFETPPLELLQCYIYMRLYHHYSPEQGDNTGFADSHVFNGIIVSLAVTLGLNRDPSTIEQYKDNFEVCNLRRRIWHLVEMFDIYQCVTLGRPIAFTTGSSSVKFPEFQSGNLDSIENRLNWGFKEYCEGHEIVSQTVSLLENATNVNIYELIRNIQTVEELKNAKFKSMAEIIHQDIDVKDKPHIRLIKVVQLIRYVFLNTCCFTLEYNVFLHFENSPKESTNLARFYFSRVVNRSNETMNILPSLMTRGSDYFGYGLDVVQFPATLLSLHKALQIQTSLSLRCQHLIKLLILKEKLGQSKQSVDTNREIQRYLKYIIRSISMKLESYLENLDSACKTYQYAWRMKRPHTLYWLITSLECFDIKDAKIVASDAEDFDKVEPDIPQTNILEGMSLEELKTLYPISNEEMKLLKLTRKLEGSIIKGDITLESPSIKDEQSPSIANLLNHDKSDSSSTDSPSSFKPPNYSNMKPVVDPTVDENWIKLLYTDQNLVVDPFNYSLTLQENHTAPQGIIDHANTSTINTEQIREIRGHLPPEHLRHTYQPVNPQFRQQAAYVGPHLVPQSPPIQLQNSQPYLQLNTYPYHLLLYNSQIAQEMPNVNISHSHGFETTLANGPNGLHEFFSLIGAGGFNTIDEMLGSVEFYDKSL